MEDWIEVQADDAAQAEHYASQLLYVMTVFGKSAIPADRPLASTDPLGVLGDEADD